MEKYELENKYYEDDEIDLVDLLKTIIREKNLVIITTVIFTVLVSGFAFYKTNRAQNYGIEVKFSNETAAKINQYNEKYKNASPVLNQIIQDSFNSLSNKTGDNSFVKIIDDKNRSYKLFTKIKRKEIESKADEFIEIVNFDDEQINKEFNKNFSREVAAAENRLKTLTEETEILNKEVMEVVEKYFDDTSMENASSNISLISPVLYIEYQQKIKDLNSAYLKDIELKEIQKNIAGNKEVIDLTGEKNITVLSPSAISKLNTKILIAVGLFLGLCAGMFFAIIKAPLKNIFKELKEEKK